MALEYFLPNRNEDQQPGVSVTLEVGDGHITSPLAAFEEQETFSLKLKPICLSWVLPGP